MRKPLEKMGNTYLTEQPLKMVFSLLASYGADVT